MQLMCAVCDQYTIISVLNIQQVAIAHHYYLLVGTVFQHWKSRYHVAIRLNRRVKIATEHSDRRLIRSVWAAWTKVCRCNVACMYAFKST